MTTRLHSIASDFEVELMRVESDAQLNEETRAELLGALERCIDRRRHRVMEPVVRVLHPHARAISRSLVQNVRPEIDVLCFHEIHRGYREQPVGIVMLQPQRLGMASAAI